MLYRIAIAILASLISTSLAAAEATKSVTVGDRVPDFTVTDVDGKVWKLSELHRKAGFDNRRVVVLTFWCSFCHSCRHVEAHLDQLAKTYKSEAAVFAIDASAGETAEIVSEFAKEKGLGLPILINSDGSAAELFGAKVTTTTVVIDQSGELRYSGRFGDGKDRPAEAALKAVLAGTEVQVKTTKQRG